MYIKVNLITVPLSGIAVAKDNGASKPSPSTNYGL